MDAQDLPPFVRTKKTKPSTVADDDGKEEDEERGALAIYSPGVRSPLAGMKN